MKKSVALKWRARVFVSEGEGGGATRRECGMEKVVGMGSCRRLKKWRREAEATGHSPE